MKKLSYVQRVMINALIKLMKKDKFKDITVTQITQEAQVARKTFYLNFKTKENLLQLAMNDLSIVFQSYLPDDCDLTIEKVAVAFFQFSKDHIDLIQLLIKNQVFFLLADEFELFIEEKIVDAKILNVTNRDQLLNIPSNYVISYHSAGLCRLLEKWVNLGMSESPEEMGKIFTQLVNIAD